MSPKTCQSLCLWAQSYHRRGFRCGRFVDAFHMKTFAVFGVVTEAICARRSQGTLACAHSRFFRER